MSSYSQRRRSRGLRPGAALHLSDGSEGDEILGIRGAEVAEMSRETHEKSLERAFRYWRGRGFPYSRLSGAETLREFDIFQRSLSRRKPEELIESKSTVGLRLANSFHPQMWHVRTYGRRRAPIEYFEDDEYLIKLLRRAPKFWPDERCWSAQAIRSLVRIVGPGRVANFRPSVAAGLIRNYSPKKGLVADFCAGFGGRQLAAIACGREYLSVDVSIDQVEGNQAMLHALNCQITRPAKCAHSCALSFLEELDRQSVDLVFTSPPYFDAELYCESPLQSYRAFPSYEEWLKGFLYEAISMSHEALKPGSHLVLVVANTRRAPVADDTLDIMQRIFGSCEVKRFPIRRLPSHSHLQMGFRSEVTVIARK